MVSYERETPVKPLNPEACSRVCSPPPSLADCTSPPLPQQLFVFHACLGSRPVVNLVKVLPKVMEYLVLKCAGHGVWGMEGGRKGGRERERASER